MVSRSCGETGTRAGASGIPLNMHWQPGAALVGGMLAGKPEVLGQEWASRCPPRRYSSAGEVGALEYPLASFPGKQAVEEAGGYKVVVGC